MCLLCAESSTQKRDNINNTDDVPCGTGIKTEICPLIRKYWKVFKVRSIVSDVGLTLTLTFQEIAEVQ